MTFRIILGGCCDGAGSARSADASECPECGRPAREHPFCGESAVPGTQDLVLPDYRRQVLCDGTHVEVAG